MKALKKAFDKLEERILLLLFIAIIFFVFLQVLNRFILHIPMLWTEEITRFMYVFCAFIGIPWATKNKASLKIDAIQQQFPRQVKIAIDILAYILAVVCAVWCFKECLDFMAFQKSAKAPAMRINMNYIYVIGPISMILVVVRSIQGLIETIRGKDKETEE